MIKVKKNNRVKKNKRVKKNNRVKKNKRVKKKNRVKKNKRVKKKNRLKKNKNKKVKKNKVSNKMMMKRQPMKYNILLDSHTLILLILGGQLAIFLLEWLFLDMLKIQNIIILL